MKNFDWTTFTIRIAVKAKLSDIYNAWTQTAEIEKWFLQNAEHIDADHTYLKPEENAQKNTAYAWRWYLYADTEFGNYTEANGTDFLQFTFAGACLVDIKLSEQGEDVIVELTQKNIPEDEDSKKNIRIGCHTGWSFYLVNLKSVYEGGLDLRNKNTNYKPMVNN